jgi:hypothetical protein
VGQLDYQINEVLILNYCVQSTPMKFWTYCLFVFFIPAGDKSFRIVYFRGELLPHSFSVVTFPSRHTIGHIFPRDGRNCLFIHSSKGCVFFSRFYSEAFCIFVENRNENSIFLSERKRDRNKKATLKFRLIFFREKFPVECQTGEVGFSMFNAMVDFYN